MWEYGWESGKLAYFPTTTHNFFHEVYCVITRLSLLTLLGVLLVNIYMAQTCFADKSPAGWHQLVASFLCAKLGYDENVSCGQGQITGLIKTELCIKQTNQTQSPKEASDLFELLGSSRKFILLIWEIDSKLKLFSQLQALRWQEASGIRFLCRVKPALSDFFCCCILSVAWAKALLLSALFFLLLLYHI